MLEEQFPESLDFLARSMRAGHAFSISLEMLGEEMADPLGQEYRTLFNEQNLGAPLDVALRNFAERVPLLDVRFFTSSVLLQKQTGGNLSEILGRLAYVIRERFRLKGQVKAASAHGRMTATDSDAATDRYHAPAAGDRAWLFAGYGGGRDRQGTHWRRYRRAVAGQFLHQEDHRYQGLSMDNPLFLCLAAFLMVMMACIWASYRFVYKPGRILKQLGTPVIAEHKHRLVEETEAPQGSTVVAVLKQIGDRVPSSDAEIANLRFGADSRRLPFRECGPGVFRPADRGRGRDVDRLHYRRAQPPDQPAD